MPRKRSLSVVVALLFAGLTTLAIVKKDRCQRYFLATSSAEASSPSDTGYGSEFDKWRRRYDCECGYVFGNYEEAKKRRTQIAQLEQ